MIDGMTTKQWLGRGIGIALRTKSLERSKEKAYSLATSTVSSLGGDVVAHSGVSRKLERYSELAAECDAQLRQWDAVTAEITKAIGHVKNHVHAALLQNRYVAGMTLEEIASEMNYSDEYVKARLLDRAIKDFEESMENVTECH